MDSDTQNGLLSINFQTFIFNVRACMQIKSVPRSGGGGGGWGGEGMIAISKIQGCRISPQSHADMLIY